MRGQALVGLNEPANADALDVEGVSSVFPREYWDLLNELMERAEWPASRRAMLDPYRNLVLPTDREDELMRALGDPEPSDLRFVERSEPTLTLPTADGLGEEYAHRQSYIDGPCVRAAGAWALARGAGVSFVDVEKGWDLAHDDLLPIGARELVESDSSEPEWRAHGTSVLGIVAARLNGSGCVGIANALRHVATATAVRSRSEPNRLSLAIVDSITHLASHASEFGDAPVLLIELQVNIFPEGVSSDQTPHERLRPQDGLPVEVFDLYFWLIRLATDLGITVIECAGNSSVVPGYGGTLRDLDRLRRMRGDHPQPLFDYDGLSSGAIVVGGCAIALGVEVAGSNVGSRVDCYAPSLGVTAPWYFDAQRRVSLVRHDFSGTSAAGAIVAGVVVLAQSARRARGMSQLPPFAIRRLLQDGVGDCNDVSHLGRRVGTVPDAASLCSAALKQ